MRERYSENSETCSPHNLWGVDTGGMVPSYPRKCISLTHIHKGLTPEVFFNPSEVWEIRGAE